MPFVLSMVHMDSDTHIGYQLYQSDPPGDILKSRQGSYLNILSPRKLPIKILPADQVDELIKKYEKVEAELEAAKK